MKESTLLLPFHTKVFWDLGEEKKKEKIKEIFVKYDRNEKSIEIGGGKKQSTLERKRVSSRKLPVLIKAAAATKPWASYWILPSNHISSCAQGDVGLTSGREDVTAVIFVSALKNGLRDKIKLQGLKTKWYQLPAAFKKNALKIKRWRQSWTLMTWWMKFKHCIF